jgi:hypothetical protein
MGWRPSADSTHKELVGEWAEVVLEVVVMLQEPGTPIVCVCDALGVHNQNKA